MSADKYKILVADDEESLRGILQEVLTDSGYHVECVADGKQALDKIQEEKDFRVLVTDIRMPEINGIELLEKVKAFDPSIEVVIMTSHGSLETAIKAIRLGAYDYLTKPFEDLDVITAVVNRTVEKLKLELEVERLVGELKQRNEDVETLYNCTAQLATTLDRNELLIKATEYLAKLGRCKKVVFFTHDPKALTIKGYKAAGWTDGKPEELSFELKGAKVVANYFKVMDNDTELKKRMGLTPAPQHTLLFPLVIDEKMEGAFAVLGEKDWTPDDKALLNQFTGNVSTQLEKAALHQQVSDLAIRDGLTGLHNHRFFQNTLAQEVERAKRFKNKLSILLFDVDNFKHYNDTNGHPMGDYLLKELGQMISSTLRKIDVAARYGGEEFVIITMETEREGAMILAERMREMIEKFDFKAKEKQPLGFVSVSIGVAEFPTDGDTREALISAADKALYKAKEGGRNKVVTAGK